MLVMVELLGLEEVRQTAQVVQLWNWMSAEEVVGERRAGDLSMELLHGQVERS